MSRSGYSDDCENLNLYRGAVDRAIGGKRGQAFLREMAAALDVMPVKELIAHDIVRDDGYVCAIGSVALARRMDVSDLDESEPDDVAARFGIARCLAAESRLALADALAAAAHGTIERIQRARRLPSVGEGALAMDKHDDKARELAKTYFDSDNPSLELDELISRRPSRRRRRGERERGEGSRRVSRVVEADERGTRARQ